MNRFLIISVFLLGLAAGPLQAQTCSLTTAERETSAPQADAELRGLACQKTTVLADLLLLDQAQAHRLQQALYDKLWQLQVQEDAQLAGQPVPAATATALVRSYYHRLLRVLSPDQYAALLRFDEAPEAPFAPLAVASRYGPADLLARSRLVHQP